MPAKSNKFDFTNRTSHGLKMGQIIGHALEKEADKVMKDAEKAQLKSQKQSNGSPDTYTHTTHLDIRAPAKDLGDDGTFALIHGLELSLVKSTDRVCLVLQDLNLANNGISTASLARLAPVVILAEHTLKSLSLANNNIQVESDEEADQWELFLRAFERCTALRRLDLTGNRQLGAKALEILAKLHTTAEHIPPCRLVVVVEEESQEIDGERGLYGTAAMDHSPDRIALQDRVRFGLRSIPYIVLKDVGLNDTGALWLSFVVEDHFYPCQLHTDGSHARADTNAGDIGGNGIDYSDNDDSLSRDGASVLKQAEKLRRQLLEDDGGFDATDSTANGEQKVSDHTRSERSRAARGSMDDEELLESGRKKLQRCAIMADGGAGKVDIWRVALRVVATSRMFLYGIGVSPARRVLPQVDQMAARSDSADIRIDCAKLTLDDNARRQSTDEQQMSRGDSAIGEIPFLVNRKQPKAAKKLVAKQRSHKLDAETAVASAPMSPCPAGSSDHTRKDAFSAGSDILPDAIPLRPPPTTSDFLAHQQHRLHAASENGTSPLTRDPAIPSQLPTSIIARIAQEPFTPRERAALTTEQLERAVRWGCERASLRKELEWRKDHDAVQVLRLLEGVGCLEYARAG